MLALQLRRSSQTSSLHTTGCLGYFDNSENYRIGIVLEYPHWNISMEIVSLKERMI